MEVPVYCATSSLYLSLSFKRTTFGLRDIIQGWKQTFGSTCHPGEYIQIVLARRIHC